MSVNPDERERRAAFLLERWPALSSGVLVGGYAIAAYGPARYSEDLDIAVTSVSRPIWEDWLNGSGAELRRSHRLQGASGARPMVQRWEMSDLAIDLMVGGVSDRDSGVEIPEDWVIQESTLVQLELISGRVSAFVRVARPEALWVMKLIAGRPQDLTDLYSISVRPVAMRAVREMLRLLRTDELDRKLRRVQVVLGSGKQYADSLSRLGLGSPTSARNRASWERFVRMVGVAIQLTEAG